jgi:hypothetical protein
MSDPLYFHRRIEFDVLKETPKALLIRVVELESNKLWEIIEDYGQEIVEPVELWIPKTWIKFDHRRRPWIWIEGLLKNVKKLAEKRLAHHEKIKSKATKIDMDTIIPEGETIH